MLATGTTMRSTMSLDVQKKVLRLHGQHRCSRHSLETENLLDLWFLKSFDSRFCPGMGLRLYRKNRAHGLDICARTLRGICLKVEVRMHTSLLHPSSPHPCPRAGVVCHRRASFSLCPFRDRHTLEEDAGVSIDQTFPQLLLRC